MRISLAIVALIVGALAAGETSAASGTSVGFSAVAITNMPIAVRGMLASELSATNGLPTAFTETAVLRSLRWLKAVQNDDGSWGGEGDAFDAATALALLTFLSHGETMASEEFGVAVRKGFEFLVADMRQTGRLERKGPPPAYGVAMSVRALSEGHSLTGIPKLRESAESGLGLILEAQRASGLWDGQYRTDGGQDDPEASVWQSMALRSGLQIGSQPQGLQDAIRRAAEGMERVLGAATNITTVAAAAHCLQFAGRGSSPAVKAAIGRLAAVVPDWNAPNSPAPVFRWYLIGMTMFHHGGSPWVSWDRSAAPMLFRNQTVLKGKEGGRDTGYWQSPGDGERYGRVYATALCTMMLEVYYVRAPAYRPLPEPIEQKPDVEVEVTL